MIMFPTNSVAKKVTPCPRRNHVSHVISPLYHAGPGRQIAFDAGTITIHEIAQPCPLSRKPDIGPTSANGGQQQTSTRCTKLRLEPGLDGLKQPEAHVAVIA